MPNWGLPLTPTNAELFPQLQSEEWFGVNYSRAYVGPINSYRNRAMPTCTYVAERNGHQYNP